MIIFAAAYWVFEQGRVFVVWFFHTKRR